MTDKTPTSDLQSAADKTTAQQMGEATKGPTGPAAPAASDAAAKRQAEVDRLALHEDIAASRKRTADLEARAAAATKPVITKFVGIMSGPFTITGENLGGVSQQNGVSINGQVAVVTAVRATSIKGTLPRGVQPGPATVRAGETTFSGEVYA